MKMKWMLCAGVLACTALNAPVVRALSIAAPMTRVVSNEGGQVSFKVVPGKDAMGPATATLTRFNDDGTEKTVWTKALVNLPGRIWVSNNWEPYVATTDGWGNAGGDHSIVVYNPKGEVVADLKGNDFLPKLPAPKTGEPMIFIADGGGRNWSMNADIAFEPRWNPTHFVVQLYDGEAKPVSMQTAEGTLTGSVRKRGEQIRVELKTGKMERMTGAQIFEANAAAKLPAPLRVMMVEAGGDKGMEVRSGNDIAIGPFGTGPGGDVAEAPKPTVDAGAMRTDAELAKQLRAAPEAAAGVTVSADLWRDMMPTVVMEGQKPAPRPLMLVARVQGNGKDEVKVERVFVVKGNTIWWTKLTPSGAGTPGEYDARNGPEWKPEDKVTVVVEGKDKAGKAFRVRAANAEIIGAM